MWVEWRDVYDEQIIDKHIYTDDNQLYLKGTLLTETPYSSMLLRLLFRYVDVGQYIVYENCLL